LLCLTPHLRHSFSLYATSNLHKRTKHTYFLYTSTMLH
jgi:hypothetical protein